MRLGERFHWKPCYESVEDNPNLSNFYRVITHWSFHLRMYFLINRLKYHKEIVATSKSVIHDRSINEDADIFAKKLYMMGKMNKREYANSASHHPFFHLTMKSLKPPDVMIYLLSTVDTSISQIVQHGRDYEQSIRLEYQE